MKILSFLYSEQTAFNISTLGWTKNLDKQVPVAGKMGAQYLLFLCGSLMGPKPISYSSRT